MTKYLIGAGGWAFFRVPSMHPLVAYSKALDFVEVNSTFYEMPSLKRVESWRELVPPNFEFAVRCNNAITHKYKFQRVPEAYKILEKMTTICRILQAKILHLQTPPTFQPNKSNAERLGNFFSATNTKGLRYALEVRDSKSCLDQSFAKTMREYNMIHCVDLSKNEEPVYKSDILYSRLFGKGTHNIYQPTDEELKKMDEKTLKGNHKRVVVSFHFIRMYKDAARFKIYKRTGEFPMVTKSTRLGSLTEVLQEDAKFPSNKNELIRRQGWKIIDLTKTRRAHASYILKKLPEKTYDNIREVVETLGALQLC